MGPKTDTRRARKAACLQLAGVLWVDLDGVVLAAGLLEIEHWAHPDHHLRPHGSC